MQMENQNRELADENSFLHEEIERLQVVLDQYLSESAPGKVGDFETVSALVIHFFQTDIWRVISCMTDWLILAHSYCSSVIIRIRKLVDLYRKADFLSEYCSIFC